MDCDKSSIKTSVGEMRFLFVVQELVELKEGRASLLLVVEGILSKIY